MLNSIFCLLQVVVRSSVEGGGEGGSNDAADLTVSDSYRGPLVTVFDLYQTLNNFKLRHGSSGAGAEGAGTAGDGAGEAGADNSSDASNNNKTRDIGKGFPGEKEDSGNVFNGEAS